MKSLFIVFGISLFLNAGSYNQVKITPSTSYVLVYHKGSSVKVHRIQNLKNHLTGEYAKISRPCPGECLQPINVAQGIQTVAEIEVIDFMQNYSNINKGVIIDARSKTHYRNDTIPSAVNIPYTLSSKKDVMKKLIEALGVKHNQDGTVDTNKAQELLVFSNGAYCDQAPTLIKAFLEWGYPPELIRYYRDGFQMWKMLGFTTVVSTKGDKNE